MDRVSLQKRTKDFHLLVIELCKYLPYNSVGFEVGKQLIRSAGSVGANYRATVRAKSQADFIYKIEVVLEEADESLYWLEIIQESNLSNFPKINQLIQEARELTEIFAATDKTLKTKYKNYKSDIRHQK
jgi:four helix bundle protein